MPMNMSVLTGAIITHAIEVIIIIKSLTVYNWKNDTSAFMWCGADRLMFTYESYHRLAHISGFFYEKYSNES